VVERDEREVVFWWLCFQDSLRSGSPRGVSVLRDSKTDTQHTRPETNVSKYVVFTIPHKK
jgi:hypothetical protein